MFDLDDGIGCSPGGAFDTSHESSFGVDDLFKEVHEDTETRDDLYKEIDHPVDVDTHIRDDLLKEIEDPVDMDTQVQYVDVGNHKAPESSAGVVIGNEVSETVKHPDSYGTPGTSYSREEPPAGVVEIKVPIKDDTNIVGSIDTIVKGNEDGGKNTENTGSWPNSLHEMLENIPYKEKPYVSVDSNSYYSYHEPGDNGKVEVYSYWGPGSVDVKEPPKKPPGPKPKPENPIMDVGSSLLREIVRVPLAIKDELKRFALKLLKFTGKGVKGLIKEAKRIILKVNNTLPSIDFVLRHKQNDVILYKLRGATIQNTFFLEN